MPNDQSNGTGAQNGSENTGYSADYVKQLREEAATWRTKFRETEERVNQIEADRQKEKRTSSIQDEFSKRGIQGVNPNWIDVPEGMTPDLAVDKFLKDYPQFLPKVEEKPRRNPFTGKPMVPNSDNSNIENTAKSEIAAIKKDPVARSKLRDRYRAMLAEGSRSTYTI